MFDLSKNELAKLDHQLAPAMTRATSHSAETEQLAIDAARLLSCTTTRLSEFQSKGFFKRCWYGLSGKTGAIERANVADLIQMQKMGWRYLTLLNERDLMLAQTIITVKNNLLTLAIHEEKTRQAITLLANGMGDRFLSLERRVDRLEDVTRMHSWLLALPAQDYDEKYPPGIRFLKLVRDFHDLRSGEWGVQEIKLLQSAVEMVGFEGRQRVSLEKLLDTLLREIDQVTFNAYAELVLLRAHKDGRVIPPRYVLESIAAPSFTALYCLVLDYPTTSATIDALRSDLKICRHDALKKSILTSVREEGIDTNAALPLRDLAVELLTCMGLATKLYMAGDVTSAVQTTERKPAGVERKPGNGAKRVGSVMTSEAKAPASAAAEPGSGMDDDLRPLMKAAEEGDADAQCRAARHFLGKAHGRGAGDARIGVDWLTKSAQQGNAEAQCLLGVALREGVGGARDQEAGFVFLKKAADQGNAGAQYLLWEASERHKEPGFCVGDSDKETALAFLKKAAKQGDVQVMYLLLYPLTDKVNSSRLTDHDVGLIWLLQAAESGHVNAMERLARWHAEGGFHDEKGQYFHDELALKWYQRAAEAGSRFAVYEVADRLRKGKGTPVDHAAALEFYTKVSRESKDEELRKWAESNIARYERGEWGDEPGLGKIHTILSEKTTRGKSDANCAPAQGREAAPRILKGQEATVKDQTPVKDQEATKEEKRSSPDPWLDLFHYLFRDDPGVTPR